MDKGDSKYQRLSSKQEDELEDCTLRTRLPFRASLSDLPTSDPYDAVIKPKLNIT